MKFFALLLISLVAVCYAADEVAPQEAVRESVFKQLAEGAEKLTAQMKEAAENGAKELEERIRDAIEKVKAATEAGSKNFGEKWNDASKKLKDVAEKVKEATQGGVKNLTAMLKEVSEKAKEAAEKFNQGGSKSFADKMKEVSEKAKEAAQKVKEAAQNGAQNFAEKLKEATDKVKEATVDRVVAFVDEKKKEIQDLAEETKQLALKAADDCQKLTGISDETIEGLKNGDFKKQEVEENTKLFIACYLEGLGFIESGKPRLDVIAKRMSAMVGPAKLVGTLLHCGGVGGADELDKTMKTYECFFDRDTVVLK